ncbi:MAG: ATP-binding protein [Baekduia sp.]
MASAHLPPIGLLFPLGGPVPSDLIIGRDGEIDAVLHQLREGISTLLAGPRRIGKTTVCNEVCRRLTEQGAMIVKVEVPERATSADLLHQLVDACSSLHVPRAHDTVEVLRPVVERLLADAGIPLDLRALTPKRRAESMRTVLSLPSFIARRCDRPVLFFLDELQRVAGYEDGGAVLTDLMDLYAGHEKVVVLVDGSDERTFADLLGPPIHFGKLVDRIPLPTTIPDRVWRQPLTERFAAAGLRLDERQREAIIAFGAGRPYDTIAAARHTALTARRLGSTAITDFDVQMGLDAARRHLEDDGA